jgi:hypothetical protein
MWRNMSVHFDTETYLKFLGRTLSRVYLDRNSNESYSFEELFFELRIDEGRFAFQSYSDRMKQARDTFNQNSGDTIRSQVSASIKSMIQEFSSAERDLIPIPSKIPESSKPDQRPNVINTSIKNENRLLNEKIIGKIEGYQKSSRTVIKRLRGENNPNFQKPEAQKDATFDREMQSNLVDVHESQDQDSRSLLDYETERGIGKSSLIINKTGIPSRVLAIASAGHGKTTMLKRIALFYSHSNHLGVHDQTIQRKYSLHGDLIPVIVRLRDYPNSESVFTKLITKSICDVIRSSQSEGVFSDDTENALDITVANWLETITSRLLLLIDGLDEITNHFRVQFLRSLDEYLKEHPETHIIMTSRAAGLSESGIRSKLEDMNFRGRSIVALIDEDVRAYAMSWITATQPKHQHDTLLMAVDQIMNQKKFEFLREFMRTPLELLIILKQIVNDTISLNRHQLFHDMLWEVITNHVVDSEKKSAVFEDTMTFLSYIAYQMQINGTLSITQTDIERSLEYYNQLSFQTDIFSKRDVTTFIGFLEGLSSNVGVIEKDDRTNDVAYVFPIRAHQEFLCSYACCHLRLSSSQTRPDPSMVISEHIEDSRWISVINFVLSDLGNDNLEMFEKVLFMVFSTTKNVDLIQTVVEADHSVGLPQAIALCENQFKSSRLSPTQQELLRYSLNMRTSFSISNALRNLYRDSDWIGERGYLEAFSISLIVTCLKNGESPLVMAKQHLLSISQKNARVGAMMISLLVKIIFGERYSGYKGHTSDVVVISNQVVDSLHQWAVQSRDYTFVEALTNLWLTRLEGYEVIYPILDLDLISVVIDEIDKQNQLALRVFLKGVEASQDPVFYELKELFSTLGSFPILSKANQSTKKDIFISGLLEMFRVRSVRDRQLDVIAMETALYYYESGIEELLNYWVNNVCKGMPSLQVGNPFRIEREQNHFLNLRETIQSLESTFQQTTPNKKIKSALGYFTDGEVVRAAQHCIKNMRMEEDESDLINLAFLIRYGHLSRDELNTDMELDLPSLLAKGVAQKEPYAVMNMALYHLEQENFDEAHSLLSSLSSEQWDDVTEGFWLPNLWIDRNHDPEGALVCVLANLYVGRAFDDLKIMKQVADPKILESIRSRISNNQSKQPLND